MSFPVMLREVDCGTELLSKEKIAYEIILYVDDPLQGPHSIL